MNQKKWIQVIAIIVILLSANLRVISTSFDESLIDDQKQKRVTELEPNDSSFDAFDQRISLLMKLAGFPSLSACIIQNDEVMWSQGYGYYDLNDKKPATVDTIYLLASVTKTIVGTAVMQLFEQD